MNKLILYILSFVLILSSVNAIDFNVIDELNNGNSKDINSRVIDNNIRQGLIQDNRELNDVSLNRHKKLYTTDEINQSLKVLESNKFNPRLINNNEDRELLQVRRDRLSKRDQVHNPMGMVTGRNLNNAKVIINKNLVSVTDYSRTLNDYFEVRMFVGTPNTNVSIGKYEGFTYNKTYAREHSEHYGYYMSDSDGFIEFTTTSFSTFVGTVPNWILTGNSGQTRSYNQYFYDYDSAFLTFYVNGIFQSLQVGEFSATGGAVYTNPNFEITMTYDPSTTVALVYFECFDADIDISPATMSAYNDATDSPVASSNQFDMKCQEQLNPPSQIASIANVNLDGTESISLNMNNFFTNYDTIQVEFNDGFSSQSITRSLGQVWQSVTGGDIEVTLAPTSSTIALNIFGVDESYSGSFTVTASNNDGSVQDSFNVNVDPIPISTPPTNPTQIPNVNLVGFNSQTLSMNNYFSNYDTISVSFSDNSATQSLTRSKGQSLTSYDGVDVDVQLIPSSNNIDLVIFGVDESYSDSFTVTASNNDGNIIDTFTVDITEQTTTGGGGGGSSPDAPDPSGTIAYYTFDENTGTTAGDSTSNGNDGTINGATWTTGVVNSGLSFDGNTDYISITPMINSWRDGDYTISSWIYTDGSGELKVIYAEGNSGNNNHMGRFELDEDNKLKVAVRSGGTGSSDRTSISNVPIPLNEWVHAVVVVSGDILNPQFYINGVNVGSSVISSGSAGNPSVNTASIGAIIRTVIGLYLKGDIDEVAIFDYALSSAEVSYLYNGGSPTSAQQYDFTGGAQSNTPSQVASFQNTYTLSGTDSLSLNLNNFFDNYDFATVTFNADGQLRELETLTQNLDEYSGTDINTVLSYNSGTDLHTLLITAQDINYNSIFEVEVCNEISAGDYDCITDLFTVVTTETLAGNLPSQIASFADVTITGQDNYILDLNNFFNNFNSITVSFDDPDTLSTQTITLNTDIASDQVIYTTSLFEVRLTSLLNFNTFALENFNENFNTSITLSATNNDGTTTGNTFTITGLSGSAGNGGVTPTPPPTDVPSWFPQPPEDQRLFWAIIIIISTVALVSLSNRSDSFLASSSFGVVAGVGLFILFALIGWIPIWTVVLLVIILLLFISAMIRRSIGD